MASNNGQFQKGHKGGLRKGVKNKRTEQWEIFSEYCLNGGLERFEQELHKLNGRDYVNAFMSLLEFHKPKLARTEVKHEGEVGVNINEIKNYGN